MFMYLLVIISLGFTLRNPWAVSFQLLLIAKCFPYYGEKEVPQSAFRNRLLESTDKIKSQNSGEQGKNREAKNRDETKKFKNVVSYDV